MPGLPWRPCSCCWFARAYLRSRRSRMPGLKVKLKVRAIKVKESRLRVLRAICSAGSRLRTCLCGTRPAPGCRFKMLICHGRHGHFCLGTWRSSISKRRSSKCCVALCSRRQNPAHKLRCLTEFSSLSFRLMRWIWPVGSPGPRNLTVCKAVSICRGGQALLHWICDRAATLEISPPSISPGAVTR